MTNKERLQTMYNEYQKMAKRGSEMKGKWKKGMMVGIDCNSQPIRVGDTVRLNVQYVRYGDWHEENWECEVIGKPKGELPILRRISDDWIVNLDFDPESDIEKVSK